MKRILQVTNYFYPNIGGIEQTTRDIANTINLSGKYEQRIICFNENACEGEHICKRRETAIDIIDGVEVIRCGSITKIASQSISFSMGKMMKKLMDGFNPDIVIFHYPTPFEAAYVLKYLNPQMKLILYWHLDIVRQKVIGKLFNSQNERLLERANKIIATSQLYIQGSSYLSRYKDKCSVIPSCINETRLMVTNRIREKANEIRKNYAEKVICFGVGRHIPYKGFSYFVEASKHLDERFVCLIGGQGELTEKLKEQAEGDSKVIFLGRLSEEDLIANYLAMDIFCFPSITKNEAFGLSLAEAMYFSKPAITFTIPGSGVNFVCADGQTGIEVKEQSAIAYAQAIKRLASDPELRTKMGIEGKKRVESNFLFEQYSSNILNELEIC